MYQVEVSQKKWVWYSTAESSDARIVSVLAVVELVTAVSVSLWLTTWWGWTHVAVGMCVAPFLLLRTDESTKLGVAWFVGLSKRLEGQSPECFGTVVETALVALLVVVGLGVVVTVGNVFAAVTIGNVVFAAAALVALVVFVVFVVVALRKNAVAVCVIAAALVAVVAVVVFVAVALGRNVVDVVALVALFALVAVVKLVVNIVRDDVNACGQSILLVLNVLMGDDDDAPNAFNALNTPHDDDDAIQAAVKSARAAGGLGVVRKTNQSDLNTLDALNATIGNIAAVTTPFCRLGATVFMLLRHPVRTVLAIPANWSRMVLCTDALRPPEPVPGLKVTATTPRPENVFDLRGLANTLGKRSGIAKFFFGYFLFPVILAFIIAWAYRWSLKATAIVWLPLLWIIPKATTKLRLVARLAFVNQSSWGRTVVLFSVVVLLTFIAKVAPYSGVHEVAAWWCSLSFANGLERLVEPNAIPLWQIGSATNAVLAIGLYMLASHQLIAIKELGKFEAEMKTTDVVMKAGAVVRATLSLYTIACLGYIVAGLASSWNLPPLSDKLVPWW